MAMASIKSVSILALTAFSLDAPLAVGTLARAIDLSFTSSANVEIFKMEFQYDDRDLVLAGSRPNNDQFHSLSWREERIGVWGACYGFSCLWLGQWEYPHLEFVEYRSWSESNVRFGETGRSGNSLSGEIKMNGSNYWHSVLLFIVQIMGNFMYLTLLFANFIFFPNTPLRHWWGQGVAGDVEIEM